MRADKEVSGLRAHRHSSEKVNALLVQRRVRGVPGYTGHLGSQQKGFPVLERAAEASVGDKGPF